MLRGETMEKEKCLQAMDFLKDWKTWRETLGDSIAAARKFGVSDETIKQMSVKMGDFLAEKVCPATKEEELLKEMWDVATPEERKTIAGLIFKMVE
jgi:sulfur relay (sulfurtransferase) DsrC/TusE family protein